MRQVAGPLLWAALLATGLAAQPPDESPVDDVPMFPLPGGSDEGDEPESDPAADEPGGEPVDSDPTGYFGAVTDDRQKLPGVRILEVVPGGPAEAAGLEANDLITAINDQEVSRMADFARVMQSSSAGDEIKVAYQRGGTLKKAGKPAETVVTLGKRPPPRERAFPDFGLIETPGTAGESGDEPPQPRGLLGIRMVKFDASFVRRLRVPARSGVIVSEVYPGSPAESAGIPRNAVIVSLNGRPVNTPAELAAAVSAAGPGREVEMGYYSGPQLNKRRLTLGGPPAEKPRAVRRPVAAERNGKLNDPPAAERDLAQEVELLKKQVQNLHERLQALEKKQPREPADE